MALLNFKKQFVEPIREGRKQHTIRSTRKWPIRVGDKLYLYCGARTKSCFKIIDEPQICTKVYQVQIRIVMSGLEVREEKVILDGQKLDASELAALAESDGFSDWNQMRWFWLKTHGKAKRVRRIRYLVVNFTGQIIHWKFSPTEHTQIGETGKCISAKGRAAGKSSRVETASVQKSAAAPITTTNGVISSKKSARAKGSARRAV